MIRNDVVQISKNMGMKHNVTFRVIDQSTNEVVSVHEGHNAATNSMLTGIAHYLTGDGIFNQAHEILTQYVPKYISLGTMGLFNQNYDEHGWPAGIGNSKDDDEETRFKDYMDEIPGFGADGYSANKNNHRFAFGLGPMFQDRLGGKPIRGTLDLGEFEIKCACEKCEEVHHECKNCDKAIKTPKEQYFWDTRESVQCELISIDHPRVPISYREVVPETDAEIKETIDVVYSAMIGTGALARFRDPWHDHIFITEAGLWSKRYWEDGGENGLLAAYRIAPPDQANWDMESQTNRDLLKQQILRVGKNQVVQVIWKIQIGALDQLSSTLGGRSKDLRWIIWTPDTDIDGSSNAPGSASGPQEFDPKEIYKLVGTVN